jgi:hypothetical protein
LGLLFLLLFLLLRGLAGGLPATIASYFFLPTPEPAAGLMYVAVDLSFGPLDGTSARLRSSGGEEVRAPAAARSKGACGEGSREFPRELTPARSLEGGS